MNSLLFVVLAFIFMYIGRKIGWALSRSILYPAHAGISALVCVGWGVAVGYGVHALISWQHPNIIVKVIFGFLLGAYVAVPSFGLVVESSISQQAMPKHNMTFTLPVFVYIATLFVLAWLA